jgi:hypothetical protein
VVIVITKAVKAIILSIGFLLLGAKKLAPQRPLQRTETA